MKRRLLRGILLGLSLLATVKICILGLGIDEEYAVTMACRILTGDRMFLEMWEPHQTSGFLTAGLAAVFVRVTGSYDYLILFLRFSGAGIQALISLFLYRTLRKRFSEEAAFFVAVFFYNTLPKWIQTPEFANMLVWFSTLAFACFLRYFLPLEEKWAGKRLWLVAAGACLSAMVLAYPSLVLAIPLILLGVWKLEEGSGKRKWLAVVTVLGTCAVLGLGYLVFFLCSMTPEEFLYGFGQMMTDGAHAFTPAERLASYGQELLTLLGFVGAAILPAGIFVAVSKRLRTKRKFFLLVLLFSLAEQVIYWLGNSRYLQEPLIYYHLLFLAGVCLSGNRKASGNEEGQKRRVLFWMGSVAGLCIWLSALVITNTTISVTGSYLMPGLIAALLLLWDETAERGQMYLQKTVLWCLVGTTLFAKGFLVCSTEGIKDNVTMVRQKALYGPAKGIYCRYMDGFVYNTVAQLMSEVIGEGCPVLYVGEHSVYYLLGEQRICNYSTISTPTFDERLGEYWDRYPEKVPKYVICDTKEEELEALKVLLDWGDLVSRRELLENLEPVSVYEILGRRE